jgi:cytochrome P450
MNIHAPQFFVPPRPPMPTGELGWYRLLKAVRTNTLQIWPREAYEQDILAQYFLGRRRFLLNSPEAIHRVLVENTANYCRTPATIRILRPIVGDGLLLSEGEDWRHQRRTIAPALAPRVLPMLARHVASATDEAIARLAAVREPVDLLAAMQVLALEIAARSMFSLEMRQYGAALRGLIERFAPSLGRPYFLDMMLPIAIPTPRDFARMRFRAKWVALMDEIIAARLEAPPSDKPRDLFDMLLAARDPETGAAFSRAQLRDQMATMIVAGHETTALTLFWSMYLLASAPAEQERLAQEVRALDLGADAAGEVLATLPGTRAVVNEALRLYPPAFVIARMAIATDQVGGVEIPARSLVMIAPWVLHRHVRLWKDPDAFNPARFLARHQTDAKAASPGDAAADHPGAQSDAKPASTFADRAAGDGPQAHRFAYLPFGAGPRVCVGAQFALAEASLVLAKLIQRFEVALADDAPVLPLAIITTTPDHPARFWLRARR